MKIIYSIARITVLLFLRSITRIRVFGKDNLSSSGGQLIVSNHKSFLDGILLSIASKRKVTFFIDSHYYSKKIATFIARSFDAIPIDFSQSKKDLESSMQPAVDAINASETVCFFAEADITKIGFLRKFRDEFAYISKKTGSAIVPAFIGDSELVGNLKFNARRLLVGRFSRYRVSVHFGEVLSSDATAKEVHQRVSLLGCDYFEKLKEERKSLGYRFIAVARRNLLRESISDSMGEKLSYAKLLVASIALATKIKRSSRNQECIGVFLPSSCPAVVVNLAIAIVGKVIVNLNYTASKTARDIAVQECELQSIYTSRRFLKKLPNIEERPEYIYLEDLAKEIGKLDRIDALFKSLFFPRRVLCPQDNFTADSIATIIYSSGSSGRAKGVMLSHHNIISNVEAAQIIFDIKREDSLCGVLPFFHSFGFTCTIWLPLLSGASASYIPNPLESLTVAKVIRQKKCSILLATPTFISNYTRRIDSEDFASLRIVLVGAEKLKKKIADAFIAKFGKELLEGYGATELSPVTTLNMTNVETHNGIQVANKPNTVGMAVPGVTLKVVDVNTFETLGPQEQGLLCVRGPNVMVGYKNMEQETQDVLEDGWYCSGDIAKIDEDGFVSIVDRLSRFSKIGGEMVAHVVVEEFFMNLGDWDHQVVAISSVPDDRKGEQLVVLYLDEIKEDIDEFYEKITSSDLANIYKPKRSNYFAVDSFPVLGTGKLDILGLRRLALDAMLSE